MSENTVAQLVVPLKSASTPVGRPDAHCPSFTLMAFHRPPYIDGDRLV